MRQSPEFQRIQENMQPGKLTAHGFLGEDARNLADILAEDNAVVGKLGLTHEAIAARMRYFTGKGTDGLGNPVIVDEIYQVVVEDHRGIMPCPFSDNVKVDKRNTRVTNLKLNRDIHWSDLNIHMIEKHGFYEGRDAFFRVDPAAVAEVLGMI